MTILSLPSWFSPQNFQLALMTPSQSFRSDLNGATQVNVLPGDQWSTTLIPPQMVGAKAREFAAFLVSLRGRAGRFYCLPFDHKMPDGSNLGAGLVQGAGQTGTSLIIDGLTANQTKYLLPGDYFQVGNELKMVTATIPTNSIGVATLQFGPALRYSPADNAPITTINPKCVMMLADDDQVKWTVNSDKFYSVPIACIEALDI